MMVRRTVAIGAIMLGASLVAARARAEGQPARQHEVPAHGQAQRPLLDQPHRSAEHAAHHEHDDAAKSPEGDENAPPEPINWWHGLLGEKGDVPPSLLWREPGAPPPFLAALVNFGVLVFIAVRYGKRPLREALLKRKESIVRDLEDAKRLREAAEKRLAEYEGKLAKIHEDFERVRLEFRKQGELDKQRIVTEAKERRERMKKDAEVLLLQEVKQMRQDLVAEVVRDATRLAAALLAKEMTLGDHDRFAEMFLTELRSGGRPTGSGAVAASAAAKGHSS